MLKIEQNWGKTANYPPNALQRSAPMLHSTVIAGLTRVFCLHVSTKERY